MLQLGTYQVPIEGTDSSLVLDTIKYYVRVQQPNKWWNTPIIVEWDDDCGWVIYDCEWWIDENLIRQTGYPDEFQCEDFSYILARLKKYYQKYYVEGGNGKI